MSAEPLGKWGPHTISTLDRGLSGREPGSVKGPLLGLGKKRQ